MEHVSGVMRPEFLVVVPADGGRRAEILRLGDVVRAPHADELRAVHRQLVVDHAERLDEDREVVRVARHDLQEPVLSRDEGRVVDPARVHLSEAELRPLREKPTRPLEVLVERLLVLVPRWRAVDDDGRAFHRLLGRIGDVVAEGFEVRELVFLGREVRAARHEVSHLRPLGLHRRALVKRHFVDPEALLEVREEPDEGLSDRPGADDVNDVFHDALLAGPEVWWPLIVGFLL